MNYKMVRLVLSKDFDPSRVVFAKKTNPMNEAGSITSCRISYNYPDPEEESRLIIQTARMRAPAGFVNSEKFGNPNKWSQLLSFSGEEKKKLINTFRRAYEALDERVIEEGISRPNEIAGQDFDEDDDEKYRNKTVRKGYKSRIRQAENATETGYSDTLRVDIPWDKENKRPRDYILFYDSNNEECDWQIALNKGCEVVCLLDVTQVWTSTTAHQFGISVKLLQMKIFQSSSSKITSLAIQNEVEEDDDVDEESVDADVEEVYVEEEIDDLE